MDILSDLTPATRRILKNLPARHSETGPTARSLTATLRISYAYTTSCLKQLFDKGLVTYEVVNRTRVWHRTAVKPEPAATIRPSRTIDDTMQDLSVMAADCTKYQTALHDIANILAETGIHLPQLSKD